MNFSTIPYSTSLAISSDLSLLVATTNRDSKVEDLFKLFDCRALLTKTDMSQYLEISTIFIKYCNKNSLHDLPIVASIFFIWASFSTKLNTSLKFK